MENIADLEIRIEDLRIKMYQVFQQSPNSVEVLRISQTLDQTLNKFEKLKIEMKESVC